MRLSAFLFIILVAVPLRAGSAGNAPGTIGKKAAEWYVKDWIQSKPLTLKDLRGKVILIRWWTGPHCPFCIDSIPILNNLHGRFREKGLVVLGFYHHKSDEPLRPKAVWQLAEKIGIEFPVAVDHHWRTLNRYWLKRAGRKAWTSVTFLIDASGIIRYIHPGGTITPEDEKKLEKEISRFLPRE